MCQLQGRVVDRVRAWIRLQSVQSNRRMETREQIPKEVLKEWQSEGENGQSEFREGISGAQLPWSQTSPTVVGVRVILPSSRFLHQQF